MAQISKPLVRLIAETDAETKINTIRASLLGDYGVSFSGLSIYPSDANKFGITIYGWSGTSSYISALTSPEKLATWIKGKQEIYSKFSKDSEVGDDVSKLLGNAQSELEVSKLFIGDFNRYKYYLGANDTLLKVSEKQRDFLNGIKKKPNPGFWDTGKLKIKPVAHVKTNRVGVPIK